TEYQLKFYYEKLRLYPVCGDGVKDLEEQCDCGSKELCQGMCSILTEKGKCCDHQNCKFKNITYQCSYGKCCIGCKNYIDITKYNKGEVCRNATNECDVPDYCNGQSKNCGPDITAPDYDMCANNTGFCYAGSCLNLNSLCQSRLKENRAFYSEDCVLHVSSMLQKCPRPTASPIIDKLLCEKTILLEKHRNTVRSIAARYMPCLWYKNGTKNFCYDGKCTNKSNLKNCKGKNCMDMNVNECI
ncbi:LOW QUALITY PROTEIN: hypothetical protein MXB_3952, partial [Myxobolus squamalis]